MSNALCAAGVNVSDIVVLVILVLGVLSGVFSGFAKMLNGALGTIIALIASVCLGIFLADKLAAIPAFSELNNKICAFFESKFSVSSCNAKVEGDKLLLFTGGNWTGVTDIFAGSSKAKIAAFIQTVCVKLFSGKLTGSVALSSFAATLIVEIITGFIIAIASLIVLEIVFSVLSSLLSRLAERHKPVHSVDRVFGLIFSTAITVLIIFVVMFVISKLGDTAVAVTDNINAGNIAKWFYENNPFNLI